jgi:hypothetical protein
MIDEILIPRYINIQLFSRINVCDVSWYVFLIWFVSVFILPYILSSFFFLELPKAYAFFLVL